MPYAHRLQGSRFELKYIISEDLVRPLRDFARSYLEPDEHADPKRNWEYEIHSLYLDSPSFTLCRATMHSNKNRFKLRIRFYDSSPDSPVFFEIKRRVAEVVLKQRARVRRDAVGELLAGHWPRRSHLADASENGNDDFGAIQQFCSLRDSLGADGVAYVSYLREAYVTAHDNSVRVTFDRLIHGTPFDGKFGMSDPAPEQAYPDIGGIVLELKFTDRFPNWLRQMVQAFHLHRVSMAKYVKCVEALFHQRPRLRPVTWELHA
ncbi:MAG: polyphosphate polymerase domain-containing protein [Phycisphaerae bacterium]